MLQTHVVVVAADRINRIIENHLIDSNQPIAPGHDDERVLLGVLHVLRQELSRKVVEAALGRLLQCVDGQVRERDDEAAARQVRHLQAQA